MKYGFVIGAMCAMGLASAAQAAPILVTAYGQLVQSPALPGSAPVDFVAPIENFSSFSAYWIIDPYAATKVVAPLPAPSVGQTVSFQGAIVDFGVTILGSGFEPLNLGYTATALRQAFLIDNSITGGTVRDQFSLSAGTSVIGGELMHGIEADRDLGENVFISMFQLSLLKIGMFPSMPDLVDGEDFPDFGAMLGTSPANVISMRFSHGTPTNAAEYQALPHIMFSASQLLIDYTVLENIDTPEPASIGLFGLGLAAVALRRRRRAA